MIQLFYAKEFKDGKMMDVTLIDFSRAGQKQLLSAEEAVFMEGRGTWEFRRGSIINVADRGGQHHR